MNYNRLILLSLAFKRLPFIAILLLVLIPNLLITFAPNITIVFTGVFLMALLCLTTIFATTISKMNIDKDLYSIPQPGDILVCVKKFNGLYSRARTKHTFEKGNILRVVKVFDYKNDWDIIVSTEGQPNHVEFRYFESKKKWVTKSDIRNNKLKKLKL